MQVTLDSSTFAVEDRVEAFTSGFSSLLPPPTTFYKANNLEGSIRATLLGSSAVLTEIDATGDLLLREARRPAGLRDSGVERVSVGAVLGGRVLTEELGRPSLEINRLRILDLSSEYKIGWEKVGHTVAFDMDCAEAGVTVDQVRTAIRRGTASPMGDLLRRHLIHMVASVEGLSPTELSAVGNSTTQLLRGLVLAASDRDSDRTEAAASTLRLRIQDYIDQHLTEPDLTPERISFAHNISLRQLYLVFSQLNETPVEWIISRRLAAARVDLTYRPDTVSAIAQKWAFKDHSHFSRRFKAKYGVTPYEYIRQLNEGDPFETTIPRRGPNSPHE